MKLGALFLALAYYVAAIVWAIKLTQRTRHNGSLKKRIAAWACWLYLSSLGPVSLLVFIALTRLHSPAPQSGSLC